MLSQAAVVSGRRPGAFEQERAGVQRVDRVGVEPEREAPVGEGRVDVACGRPPSPRYAISAGSSGGQVGAGLDGVERLVVPVCRELAAAMSRWLRTSSGAVASNSWARTTLSSVSPRAARAEIRCRRVLAASGSNRIASS
jgi:hypothetical protein